MQFKKRTFWLFWKNYIKTVKKFSFGEKTLKFYKKFLTK